MRNLRVLILVMIVGLVTGYGGYLYGRNRLQFEYKNFKPTLVLNQNSPRTEQVDFSQFWTVWDKLAQEYVDKSALDPQTMVDGAISGMVSALGDPYTIYLPAKQNAEAKQDLNGAFEGVGIQLGFKGKHLVVMSPVEGTPAFKVGVKAGDLIMHITDEVKKIDRDTENLTIPEAVSIIRGPKGQAVTLTLFREGQTDTFEVKLVRDTIVVKSATVEFTDGIAHLKLNRFGDRTQEEWGAAVEEIVAQGSSVRGIVLDLRNNPGGYLDEAVYIAGEFLPPGKLVVSQQYGDGKKVDLKVNRNGRLLKNKLIVLVNEGSASAAEILAGALQDHKRAQIVGAKTFGKGSVQQPDDFPNGAGIHITIAKWLVPSGKWIDKQGIEPSLKIEADQSASTSATPADADVQLQKAIELLR